MTELEQYINSYFGLTKDQLNLVVALFKESTLKKNEYFVKSGQYCNKLSFVHDGFIRVFATTEDKEVTQWIATKGHFVTDLHAFVFKQRARWHIQALTECTVYTIDKKNYELLNDQVPEWNDLEKKFISSCFITLEDRVFKHLSLSAEERYLDLFEENKELFNHVPLQYIASMLGMSPETLSRIRNKLTS
jgi:CRP-like cAMP-binding protein